MAIRDWPAEERPREKLLNKGATALTDAELLAIFLRVGSHGCSAVELARQLLDQFNGLNGLLGASREAFCAGKGLGDAKYAQLQAVLEMADRYFSEQLQRSEVMGSAQATRKYLQVKLRGERREVFAVMYLDVQQQLIAYEPLFFGTVDAAAVYPRELVRRALELNASRLIIAHNHPSGIAEPSQSDRRITDRIAKALNLVDMELIDHCVVAGNQVVSFAERGWL